MRGITKRFPGVVANDGVDFEAAVGEVHALLGENGAGKSTLSNILTGLYRPDEGEIFLRGRHVHFHAPRDALDAGIFMVHQHFRLVEPFTVAENVVLGDHRGAGTLVPPSPARDRASRRARSSKSYGMHVDPRARIWQLSLGEQQRVEIVKALYRDASILILDEPTAVLTPQEADVLFATLRAMAEMGSHGDLHLAQAARGEGRRRPRDRAPRRAHDRDGCDRRRHASLARGADGGTRAGRRRASTDGPTPRREAILETSGLCADDERGRAALKNVSLVARAGEIVAIAGVAGNGQRELAETIAGLRAPTAGRVAIERPRASPRRSARRDRGGRRVRPGGPARHRPRAEPQHRVEPRAQVVPRAAPRRAGRCFGCARSATARSS